MDRFGGVSRVLLSAALALVAAATTVREGAPGEYAVPLVWLLAAAIGLIAAWAYVRFRTDGQIFPMFRRMTRTHQELLGAGSEDEIATRVSTELAHLLNTDRATLVPVRHGRLVINRGTGRLEIDPGHESGFVREVAVGREIVNVVRERDATGRPIALLGVPVVLDAIVAGVLVAVRDGERPFTRAEQQVAAGLAPIVAQAIRQVRARRAGMEGADHATVMGSAGRHVLERDLLRAPGDRRHSRVAVVPPGAQHHV